MTYVSLHNHSQYSILDSTISVKELAKRAKALDMSAVALTDFGNLYGAVDFYKACLGQSIKPIIGIEVMIAPKSRHHKKKVGNERIGDSLVLLAKNKKGYQNLCKISSIAFTEGFYYYPRIDEEILSLHSEGLICLSSNLQGIVGKLSLEKEEEAEKALLNLLNLFKEDFYLELQRLDMQEEALREDGVLSETWLHHRYDDFIEKQHQVNDKLSRVLKKTRGSSCVHK